jgi:UDP-N-acetylmuramate dehydrogenase
VLFRSQGSAGRLIEEAGLKGYRIGDAQVSEKHANFIVNRGKARAQDILALVELVRQKVHQAKGIWLEMEIQVVGED